MNPADRGPIFRYRGLFLLFFLSGISGLIYESIWSRYIRQFVGSAAMAQILVLALFMGGMSLGAFLAGRGVSRIRAPVLAYGVIEGIVGLYALAFPHLQQGVMRLCYDTLFPAIGAGAGIEVVKWSMASLLILPPCVLLGMTFPIMSVGILRRAPKQSGEILSFLYFTNSFGASLGAMLSGFVFVGWLGLPGTLMVAASINFFIMVVAVRDKATNPPLAGETDASTATGRPMGRLAWLFLAVAFGTGFSSFMYEIGWIRLLSMIIGSATHSFEVMLSAFVFGLAAGGLWVRRRMDRFKRPELALAFVQMIMGMSAVATLVLYIAAVGAISVLLSNTDHRTIWTWYGFNVLRYLVCLMIMFPATFCAGMTLPLLTHVMLKRGESEGVVGQVYGVNTLGAICGAVAAGILLMPLIGLKGVIVLGALFDLVLGLFLIRSEIGRRRDVATSDEAQRRTDARLTRLLRNGALATVVVTGSGLLIPIDPRLLTSTVFRKGRFRLPEFLKIKSYVDGRTASVTVVENDSRPGHRIIYTNGKPDASVVLDRFPERRSPELGPDLAGDEPNQFLVGLLPLSIKPDATDVALIGFGSGVTCHTILGSPVLKRLDTIEIEPEMVRGGRYFHAVNYRAYEDDRNHIWFDDAKAYFASAGRKFDIIVSEPTNPWVSGVSSLFTIEFYQEAKRYLKPGGVFAQWVQGYELSNELLLSVLAAVDDEFKDYLIIRIGSRDWVIVAKADGPVSTPDPVVLEWPDTAEQFGILGIHDMGQIDGLMVANRRMLHPYVAELTPNRDALPLLDTGAEKTRFFRDSAEVLLSLRWTPAPLIEALGRIERRPYPMDGIGDLREPHVLRETEQAVWLMREFEEAAHRLPENIFITTMASWKVADADRGRGEGSWTTWLNAVYEVYRETASHLRVHETTWWAAVKGRAETAPEEIQRAVDLLGSLSALDGERLSQLVGPMLGQTDPPLPATFLEIAAMVGLELTGADRKIRRAHVKKHMTEDDIRDDSEGLAYRVLRAYGSR